MGLVAYRGHWQRPSTVAEKVRADDLSSAAALAEYNLRSASTRLNTAEEPSGSSGSGAKRRI